tara:strand:- start:329 stop:763 length:435 start_codon:yes stop_codon:yes gene_type:complete
MPEYTDGKGNKVQAVPQADVDAAKLVADALLADNAALKAAAEKAIDPAVHEAVTQELKTLKDAQEAATKADTEAQAKILTDKRAALVKAGVDEEKVKTMPLELLEVLETSIGLSKRDPKMDMGAGGGSGALTGSPLEMAKQAYS